MDDHHRLRVSDRLRGEVLAFTEEPQGRVLPLAHVVEVVLQRGPPVVARLLGALALLVEVVGAVGREPLAPVAARVVDEDAVSPPVVEDLVAVGGVEDEGQADHLIAEERERGHSESGLPEVLDEGELRERIGPDPLAVEIEVPLRPVDVAGAGRRVGVRVGEGLDRDAAVLFLPFRCTARRRRRSPPSAASRSIHRDA